LRERTGDIPLLAESLLERVAADRNLKISAVAIELLRHYDYPGNVRELRNIIERASLLCDGEAIQPMHLPEEVRSGHTLPAIPAGKSPNLKELEHQTLETRLAHHRGSRKMLADELGISERTLYRRLKQREE
jgi:DNA-binding NtrC family response regulator